MRGIVDDTDRAMADRLVETGDATIVALPSNTQQRIADAGLEQRVLEAAPSRAAGTRIRSIGAPHSSAGDHRAAVRAEADEHDAVVAVPLAHELADVDHAVVAPCR